MAYPSRTLVLAAAVALGCALALFGTPNRPKSPPHRRQLWGTLPDPKSVELKVGGVTNGIRFPRQLESGWDEQGMNLYDKAVDELTSSRGHRMVEFTKWPNVQPILVSYGQEKFWEKLSSGDWEHDTFKIFTKYIGGDTTAVDFGTWIGPTLLFHGQLSRRSLGIEADPVAYAHAERNVGLNAGLNPSWGGRVSVDPACVARPEDVGRLRMRAGKKPGLSMSGIGDKVGLANKGLVEWEVECHTLQDIFDNYWDIEKPYVDVFIKIDVESYECKLIPSFFDWLKYETHLPKMYISFHPGISSCSDEEYDGVLKFLGLYDHVLFADVEEYDVQTATIDDFSKKIDAFKTVVVYQNHHAEKINWE